MKYIVILGDGMADRPVVMLNGKTPLEVAKKPNIDYCAQHGECGMVKTIPDKMKPGSDVANISVLGYPPEKYYSGRSPLEALSMGINMLDNDIALRCNLVTLSTETSYENKSMIDYSAGEISTEEAAELIHAVNDKLGDMKYYFHAGVSYRHCLIVRDGVLDNDFTPPHDITGKPIFGHLPKDAKYLELMKKSYEILKNHPINLKRIADGKRPANSIWLWGAGTKPTLPSFEDTRHLKGAIISAVDLLKGIAIASGMHVIKVVGATGRIDTNFHGKAEACLEALNDGIDYVYIHVEAPDECGHQGEIKEKVHAIELIDKEIVGYLREKLNGQDYTMLICPDHATPLELKTHTSEPIPYIIYRSNHEEDGVDSYTEKNCKVTGIFYGSGEKLANHFLAPLATQDTTTATTVAATAVATTAVATTAVAAIAKDAVAADVDVVPSASGEQVIGEEAQIALLPSAQDTAEATTDEGDASKKAKKTKSPKTKKDKKPKTPLDPATKKKRLIAWIIIAVSFVIIAIVSIVTPIMIINKDKIFVDKAEDFIKKVDKGTYYVLNKDIVVEGDLNISNPYSIDLNKHTLKITGALSFTHNQADRTIYLGTKNGKEYINGGIVEAGVVEIICGGKFVSNAALSTRELRLTSNSSTFADGLHVDNLLSIVGGKHVFNSQLTFAEGAKFNLLDSEKTIVSFGAKTDIVATNSSIDLLEGATPLSLTLDAKSKAKIQGKVEGNVTGGENVIMTDTSSANIVSGMTRLWITRSNQNIKQIQLPEANISYIIHLETPKDMSIEHTSAGAIIVSVTKVNHAERYSFTVDDKEPLFVLANSSATGIVSCDVTAFANTFGEHIIKVVAHGAEGVDPDLVTPSKEIKLQYTHKIKLDMPTNLSVTKDADNKVWLTFDKVNFADEYLIIINGKERVHREIENLKIDITEDVLAVGSYSIRVQARSAKNEALVSSEISMTSFVSTRPHDTAIVLEQVVGEDKSITFNWNAVDTAKRYTLYVTSVDGSKREIKIHTNTYLFAAGELKSGDIVSVRADEYGYYQNGALSNILAVA